MKALLLSALLFSFGHNCNDHLWTEQQIRDTISSKRNADWYPVARGTNYAVHTLKGDGIKAPSK